MGAVGLLAVGAHKPLDEGPDCCPSWAGHARQLVGQLDFGQPLVGHADLLLGHACFSALDAPGFASPGPLDHSGFLDLLTPGPLGPFRLLVSCPLGILALPGPIRERIGLVSHNAADLLDLLADRTGQGDYKPGPVCGKVAVKFDHPLKELEIPRHRLGHVNRRQLDRVDKVCESMRCIRKTSTDFSVACRT